LIYNYEFFESEPMSCDRKFRRLVCFLLLAGSLCADARRPRIAVGGLSAESNSLYPATTPMVEAESSRLPRAQWFERIAKASTVASGVIAASSKLNLEIIPVLQAQASFLGSVERSSFEATLNELVDQIKNASPRFDGAILILHGAMVVDGYPLGDAEVAKRVRQAMGKDFPIVVTQDFHANVSQELLDNSTAVITYKEDPHLDPKDRGMQAATIIARTIRGEVKPVQAIVKPPMLLNIHFHNTFAAPLKPVVDASKRLERENPKVLAASVPGGYQWGDTIAMGPSAIVVTDNDPALAKREAQKLADQLWQLRDRLVLRVPTAAEAVKAAMASDKFPVALMDTGDNIGGGSPGDSTYLLAELIKLKAQGWVVVISDREADGAAFRAGVGGAFDQAVGAKTDRMHGSPVRVRGRVKALTDGKYVETEVRHGGERYNNMGHTAVIEVEGSTPDLPNILVLTPQPTSPNSIHQLLSNGVYPQRERILIVKGVTAPRAAYEPIAASIVEVNTPGATDINPAHFTYKHIRTGLWGVK
jgi:microcystin degradation protein MlrC